MTNAKILLFDLETAPLLGWAWGTYDTNILEVQQDWYILSVGYMWLGDRTATVVGLDDFEDYDLDRTNDRPLVELLWNLLEEADAVIAHNMKFDARKATARFIYWNMEPPSPYEEICTLRVARQYAKFSSNKLDDLANHLGIGRKVPNTGFDLWKRCMEGDRTAWRKMKQYCKKDVLLLRDVYKILAPYHRRHPNMARFDGRDSCPRCGKNALIKWGTHKAVTHTYQRWKCNECGAHSRTRLRDKDVDPPNVVSV